MTRPPVAPIAPVTTVTASAAAPSNLQVLSPLREAWRVFSRHKAAMLGLGLLVVIPLVMLFGPGLYGVHPFEIMGAPFTDPLPARKFWLGTPLPGR